MPFQWGLAPCVQERGGWGKPRGVLARTSLDAPKHQRDIVVTVLVATSEAMGALPDACDAACHLLPPPLQPPEPRLGQRGTVSPHPWHLAAPRAPREAPEPLPRFSCHPGKAPCPLAACRQSSCSAGVSPCAGSRRARRLVRARKSIHGRKSF